TNDGPPAKAVGGQTNNNGLPAKVVGGQTNFSLASATKPSAPQTFSGPGSAGPLGATSATNDGSTTTPRTVTESDIWKIRGNTLYFFNQLRGLQIIDITNPDAPARIATLPLPAVGEEMYILDDTHVVLLAQNGCSWDRSEVIAVTIANSNPAITARLDVNGIINTSRLVGRARYHPGHRQRRRQIQNGTQRRRLHRHLGSLGLDESGQPNPWQTRNFLARRPERARETRRVKYRRGRPALRHTHRRSPRLRHHRTANRSALDHRPYRSDGSAGHWPTRCARFFHLYPAGRRPARHPRHR